MHIIPKRQKKKQSRKPIKTKEHQKAKAENSIHLQQQTNKKRQANRKNVFSYLVVCARKCA